jgi:ribosome-binding factor A
MQTGKGADRMTEWREVLDGVIAADDRIKAAQKEREQINALANRIQKNISPEKRRRKGKLIKLIRQWHHPNIGFHYDRSLIRFCILQRWLEDVAKS